MKYRVLSFSLLVLAALCASASRQRIEAATPAPRPAHHYRFLKKYVDLDALKVLAEAPAASREVKRESWHASNFGLSELNRAEYKDKLFKLDKDRKTIIEDQNGKLIKTI